MGYLVKIPRTYFPWDFDLREKLFSNGKSPDEIVIYLNCDTVSVGGGREEGDFNRSRAAPGAGEGLFVKLYGSANIYR